MTFPGPEWLVSPTVRVPGRRGRIRTARERMTMDLTEIPDGV